MRTTLTDGRRIENAGSLLVSAPQKMVKLREKCWKIHDIRTSELSYLNKSSASIWPISDSE
jgi:hypothetical protein